jgi:hypothetical protein
MEERHEQNRDVWQPPIGSVQVFEAMAREFQETRPEIARLLRRCSADPFVLSLVPAEPTWDVPHRVLAAVRWLALGGDVEDFEAAEDPWAVFRGVLAERGEWVARFVREQPVQTNAVQRCFALLPLFLRVARTIGRPLNLIELGTSAGLNLFWDRYYYQYQAGAWGDPGRFEITGEERLPVPAELLATRVEVRRRLGIDLNPIDATREEGLRLLCSFPHDRFARERLRAAAQTLQLDPPEFLRGDYLELLPEVLADRDDRVITVVFQTLSSVYLSDEGRGRLRRIIDAAGEQGPLAWISTPTPEEHGQRRGDYPLELAIWPDGGRQIMARMNVGADWIEWTG